MTEKIEGVKHLQVLLEEHRYQVLRLAVVVYSQRAGRNVTQKEVLEQAIEEYCLRLLGVSDIDRALQLVNKLTGDTRHEHG